MPCKKIVQRNKTRVRQHIEHPSHTVNVNAERNVNNLSQRNYSVVEKVPKTAPIAKLTINQSNGLYTIEEDSSEKGKVRCNLCNDVLQVIWNRIREINSHENSINHKKMLELRDENPHLSFESIRELKYRRKFEDAQRQVNVADSFDYLGTFIDGTRNPPEKGIKAMCKVCQVVIDPPTNGINHAIRKHIGSEKHNDCIPREDGFTPNEFKYNAVSTLVASKSFCFKMHFI